MGKLRSVGVNILRITIIIAIICGSLLLAEALGITTTTRYFADSETEYQLRRIADALETIAEGE